VKRLRQLKRLLFITHVFVRHDLDEYVLALHLFRPYRFILRLAPWRWRPRTKVPRAVRLRLALERLGPIFVKFGQMLSTRPDLLPDDIAVELAKLQDCVPPFPGVIAKRIVEEAYGAPLGSVFAAFDLTPAASASIAQVHFARLHDGTEVAVKVLRPDIEKIIARDLELMYALARLALRYAPEARRFRPVEVVDEYKNVIHSELDLAIEAGNASRLRMNFADSNLLYVPRVYWDYTRREVLVMERIDGIPISNVEALRAAGVDMRRLAHNGVEIFFTQAFRDGFFHADMHPGNIFVSTDGQYRAVDFGIMGTLSEQDKLYLAQNLLGFFHRDYRAIAAAHVQAGWAPANTRIEEFEAAIRAVCEPIFAKPLKDISFGRVLVGLFQTARRFNIEIQPQLVLLEKTLFNIEGLGRRLYPDLDLWITAKPFLERWMREQLGPQRWLRDFQRDLPRFAHILPELPFQLHQALQSLAQGRTRDTETLSELRELRRELSRQRRNFGVAALAVGGAVGAVGVSMMATADQTIGTIAALGGALLAIASLGFLN